MAGGLKFAIEAVIRFCGQKFESFEYFLSQIIDDNAYFEVIKF